MSTTIPSTDPYLKLLFQDNFRPFYSPNDMLKLGVFGGSFFSGSKASAWELPKELFKDVPSNKSFSREYNAAENYFSVAPIFVDRTFDLEPDTKRIHPGGWFEWYCRFYYGETSTADSGRAKQWLMTINQHWYYIINGVYVGEGDKITDLAFLPERRQKLLEFGVDPTIQPTDYQSYYKF